MLIPPFLKPGDTVIILAPASPFPYDDLENAFRVLRHDWELNVLEGAHLQANIGAFAGTDEQRLADLQQAINDPRVRAIFAARGGYGSYRLIEKLDFTPLQAYPKWLVGFSDITVLLSHLQQMGIASLHAVMPRQFRLDTVADDVESLRQWLFGEAVAPYTASANSQNRLGTSVGTLAGGNLSMLVHTLGTSSEVDWAGKLLFIEDIDETIFALDRTLIQLRRSGKLANKSVPYGKTANELIAEAVSAYSYPVAFGMPVGHEGRNLAMPVGISGTLTVGQEGSSLVF